MLHLLEQRLGTQVGISHRGNGRSDIHYGIPEIWATDGPHGIRPEVLWDEWNQAGWTNDSCIAYPANTLINK